MGPSQEESFNMADLSVESSLNVEEKLSQLLMDDPQRQSIISDRPAPQGSPKKPMRYLPEKDSLNNAPSEYNQSVESNQYTNDHTHMMHEPLSYPETT